MIEIVSNQGTIDLAPMLGASAAVVDFEVEVGRATAARDAALSAAARADQGALASQAAASSAGDAVAAVPGIAEQVAIDTLASDPSVVDSAQTAVGAAAAAAGFPQGVIAYGEQDAAGGLVDADARRTWLEFDINGAPTGRAVGLILSRAGGAIQDAVNTTVGANVEFLEVNTQVVDGLAGGFLDESDRVTELVFDTDGKVPRDVVLAWRTRMGLEDVVTPEDIPAAPTYADLHGSVYQMTPINIVCSGDSLTVGAGGGGTAYPETLQQLLVDAGRAAAVSKVAEGGTTSVTIAGRLGGRPWLCTVAGGSIPASGPVGITLLPDPIDGARPAPLAQGSTGVNPVTIRGVSGTLSRSTSEVDGQTIVSYTFTRTAAGAAVSAPYAESILTAASQLHRDSIHIMWWGQNDGTTDATQIIARQRAQIEHLRSADKRYLVLGLTTSTREYRLTMAQQWTREFGRRFIDLREFLATEAGLAEMGIVPTQTDLDRIASGSVPASFLGGYPGDVTHLNGPGYALVARVVYRRLDEMGWI